MATLTVGTGKTYSTISDAITASSSGDSIEVYAGGVANTYAEKLALGAKILSISNMSGVTITISGTGGGYVYSGAGIGSTLDGFTITSTGAAAWLIGSNCFLSNCILDGASKTHSGIYVNSWTTGTVNCLVKNCVTGILSNSSASYTKHVFLTVVNCTTGFQTNSSGAGFAMYCIVAGCTTGFTTVSNFNDILCCSDDATADGVGSVTGFDTADFVDYAGGDFRLKAAVALTTKALFYGYPITHDDAFGNIRKTTGVVYAGWHDPASYPTCTGTFTATRHPSQNCVVLDLTSITTNGTYFVVAVDYGSAPSPQASFIIHKCPVAKTTVNVFTDDSYNWLTDDAAIYIDIGAEDTSGQITWLGDPQNIVASSYLSKT